jgi:pimeloyl-ACP methyl ester carboxylesterase
MSGIRVEAAPFVAGLTRSVPSLHRLRSLSAHGFHTVAWYEWGPPEARDVVICVHGVGRNGRDFDVLGEALATTHRVLAVDMPGRGRSDWLADPNDYGFATYLATLNALIAASRAETVSFVGTSMGGLLGMVLAAQPNTPVARLVVNDIGPAIEPEALTRIGGYLGADPSFDRYEDVAAYIRAIAAPFGPLTDLQWEHVARSNVRQDVQGRWHVGYDPGIAVPFRAQTAPPSLWPAWDAIRAPVLVLRGAQSDLLGAATAAAMTERGPKARLVEFQDVGHAPMLLDAAQLAPVLEFLRAPIPYNRRAPTPAERP